MSVQMLPAAPKQGVVPEFCGERDAQGVEGSLHSKGRRQKQPLYAGPLGGNNRKGGQLGALRPHDMVFEGGRPVEHVSTRLTLGHAVLRAQVHVELGRAEHLLVYPGEVGLKVKLGGEAAATCGAGHF
jgi:hypothetical protein